ncbi:hypothetical protein IV203_028238 [Nitzschia inconspicua]|nr:hypothetical protein IV203_028238 [Nitzschia inconspicua]
MEFYASPKSNRTNKLTVKKPSSSSSKPSSSSSSSSSSSKMFDNNSNYKYSSYQQHCPKPTSGRSHGTMSTERSSSPETPHENTLKRVELSGWKTGVGVFGSRDDDNSTTTSTTTSTTRSTGTTPSRLRSSSGGGGTTSNTSSKNKPRRTEQQERRTTSLSLRKTKKKLGEDLVANKTTDSKDAYPRNNNNNNNKYHPPLKTKVNDDDNDDIPYQLPPAFRLYSMNKNQSPTTPNNDHNKGKLGNGVVPDIQGSMMTKTGSSQKKILRSNKTTEESKKRDKQQQEEDSNGNMSLQGRIKDRKVHRRYDRDHDEDDHDEDDDQSLEGPTSSSRHTTMGSPTKGTTKSSSRRCNSRDRNNNERDNNNRLFPNDKEVQMDEKASPSSRVEKKQQQQLLLPRWNIVGRLMNRPKSELPVVGEESCKRAECKKQQRDNNNNNNNSFGRMHREEEANDGHREGRSEIPTLVKLNRSTSLDPLQKRIKPGKERKDDRLEEKTKTSKRSSSVGPLHKNREGRKDRKEERPDRLDEKTEKSKRSSSIGPLHKKRQEPDLRESRLEANKEKTRRSNSNGPLHKKKKDEIDAKNEGVRVKKKIATSSMDEIFGTVEEVRQAKQVKQPSPITVNAVHGNKSALAAWKMRESFKHSPTKQVQHRPFTTSAAKIATTIESNQDDSRNNEGKYDSVPSLFLAPKSCRKAPVRSFATTGSNTDSRRAMRTVNGNEEADLPPAFRHLTPKKHQGNDEA